MKYKFEILALLALIILVVLYFVFIDKNKEGLTDYERKQLKKDVARATNFYLNKQQNYYSGRKLPTTAPGAYGDTVFVKVSEDKAKTDIRSGKIGLPRDYPAEDDELSELGKKIQNCRNINKSKQCSLITEESECGYCLDTNMIVHGDKDGPTVHVCGGGGQKNTWVPPGPNAAFNCQKMKDRAFCNRMKDCGDTKFAHKCGWCPISGKGIAKEWKDGGWHPKYKDDKCEWPYEGIKTTVKFYGYGESRPGQGQTGIGGSCNNEKDCAPGLKCGRDPHRTENTIGLKGRHQDFGSGQDYCYDPGFAGMNGPLVAIQDCEKFKQQFPCMGPKMLTGPHSDECYKDLWKKSGCIGDVNVRLASVNGTGLKKIWNKNSYANVLNSMANVPNKAQSKNYQEAKKNTMLCYGVEVNSCEDRFVSEKDKKKRPRDCLVNLYEQSGCKNKGRLHPDNIEKTVREDARKRNGVKKEWELGTFYRWKPQEYLKKLKEVKSRADKLTTVSNVATYDEGIKLYENCYGKPPSTYTFPIKKPCWKDFTNIMKQSHPGVIITKDENKVIYNKNRIGIDSSFMSDNDTNRTRLAGEGKTGHDWGNSKTITKEMYKKPYFPFWQFLSNSRSIYQGGAELQPSGPADSSLSLSESECKRYAQSIKAPYRAGSWGGDPPKCFKCQPGRCPHRSEQGYVFYNRRNVNNNCGSNRYDCVVKKSKQTPIRENKWQDFKSRALKINGVKDLGADTLTFAPFMNVGRTLRNYGLAKKRTMAHIPVNGRCSSCNLVPAGQCQEGCKPVTHPKGGANACRTIGGIRNKGKKPSSCIVPSGSVLTKKMFMRNDFPYWEFMRILKRFESN